MHIHSFKISTDCCFPIWCVLIEPTSNITTTSTNHNGFKENFMPIHSEVALIKDLVKSNVMDLLRFVCKYLFKFNEKNKTKKKNTIIAYFSHQMKVCSDGSQSPLVHSGVFFLHSFHVLSPTHDGDVFLTPRLEKLLQFVTIFGQCCCSL